MNTMNKPKIYYVHKRNLFDANDVVEKEIQHPDLVAVYLIHAAGLLQRIAKAARRFANAHGEAALAVKDGPEYRAACEELFIALEQYEAKGDADVTG